VLVPLSGAFAQTAETVEVAATDTVTRAEFARSVVEIIRTPEELETIRGRRITPRFDDVSIEHWAAVYVSHLNLNNAITQGYGMWMFRPDEPIRVEEAVAMLLRTLGYVNTTRIFQPDFPQVYLESAKEIGLTDDINFTVGEYATLEVLQTLLNRVSYILEVREAEREAARIASEAKRDIALADPVYVTRAEMARIAVQLRNFGNTAHVDRELQRWGTGFDDVPLEHWAASYISMAVGMDVVRGCGNVHEVRHFRPYDNVRVEEVMVILVRVLGRRFVEGGFPLGYITVADEMFGLIEGVEFAVGEHSTRELVYVLINRVLDTPLFFSHAPWDSSHGRGPFIADGLDGRPFRTIRTEIWNELPIYFDGENFVILDVEN